MKRERTLRLIETENFGVSAKVVTVVKKTATPVTVAAAVEWFEQWDAAILAAADSLGAGTVFYEDLSDGQQYGRIRVVNPFR